ncbi:unnamed protein product [Blepharisma stoltei]|uniref:Uncharacterized protein n=1 Tax=Blepharisma stoltei TaxID=1481888 RepID=A0AAU9JB60_9CILI|nr:unnamed protein product [Blepharisma stoltei]
MEINLANLNVIKNAEVTAQSDRAAARKKLLERACSRKSPSLTKGFIQSTEPDMMAGQTLKSSSSQESLLSIRSMLDTPYEIHDYNPRQPPQPISLEPRPDKRATTPTTAVKTRSITPALRNEFPSHHISESDAWTTFEAKNIKKPKMKENTVPFSLIILEKYLSDVCTSIANSKKITNEISMKAYSMIDVLNDCYQLIPDMSIEFYSLMSEILHDIIERPNREHYTIIVNKISEAACIIQNNQFIDNQRFATRISLKNLKSEDRLISDLTEKMGKITPRMVNLWRRLVAHDETIEALSYAFMIIFAGVDKNIETLSSGKILSSRVKENVVKLTANPGHVVQTTRKTFEYIKNHAFSQVNIKKAREILDKINVDQVRKCDLTCTALALYEFLITTVELCEATFEKPSVKEIQPKKIVKTASGSVHKSTSPIREVPKISHEAKIDVNYVTVSDKSFGCEHKRTISQDNVFHGGYSPVVDIQELSRKSSVSVLRQETPKIFTREQDPVAMAKKKLDETMKTTKEILKQSPSKRAPLRVEKKVIKKVSKLEDTKNSTPITSRNTTPKRETPVKKSIHSDPKPNYTRSPSLTSEESPELSKSFTKLETYDSSYKSAEFGDFIEKTFREYLKKAINKDSSKIDPSKRQQLLEEYQRHLGMEIVKSLNSKLGKEDKLEEEIIKARQEIEEVKQGRASPVRLKPKKIK